MRNINTIAAEIHILWKRNPPPASVVTHAKPYLEAMEEIKTIRDTYGLETGDDLVIRFLVNVANWRGMEARRIKAELNLHVRGIHVRH